MEKIISKIATEALRYPSPGNCQPFEIEFTNHDLTILYKNSITGHAFNFSNHAALCAMGILVEYIDIVSSKYGLSCNFTYLKNNNVVPNVKVNFKNESIDKDPLYDYIYDRHTDRSIYKLVEIPKNVIDKFKTLNSKYKMCSLTIEDKTLDNNTLKYLSKSDTLLWNYKKASKDFFDWYQPKGVDYRKNKIGLYSQHMAMDFPTRIIFSLLKKSPLFRRIFRPIVSRIAVNLAYRQFKSSSLTLMFNVKKNCNQPEAIIELGRLSARSWLMLTKEGLVAQPMSQGVLPLLSINTLNTLSGFPLKNLKHLLTGNEILSKQFHLKNDELPFWIIRSGISSQNSANIITLRKNCLKKTA